MNKVVETGLSLLIFPAVILFFYCLAGRGDKKTYSSQPEDNHSLAGIKYDYEEEDSYEKALEGRDELAEYIEYLCGEKDLLYESIIAVDVDGLNDTLYYRDWVIETDEGDAAWDKWDEME